MKGKLTRAERTLESIELGDKIEVFLKWYNKVDIKIREIGFDFKEV